MRECNFKLLFFFTNSHTGKKWHDRRKVLTPAFHFNILERFVETFDRIGNNVVDKLKKFDTTDDVEFYPIALLYALDVMCGKLKSTVDMINTTQHRAGRQAGRQYKYKKNIDRHTWNVQYVNRLIIVIFKIVAFFKHDLVSYN